MAEFVVLHTWVHDAPVSSPAPNPPTPASWCQPCVPATPSATGSYPGLLGTDECPTRLQRGGSPIGRHHTDRAKLSPVRTKKEASGFKGVGGIADGVLARSGCGREGGVGVHQTLVEQLSMTGAQFLDLVVSRAKDVWLNQL